MQLIINADDFGLSSGVNQGVFECFQAGSLSSATLMVNMPATEESVAFIRENPTLGVGLHFSLTLGSPVCEPDHVASLVNTDGNFWPRRIVEKHAIIGKLKPTEVSRELYAQIARFERFGLVPTHLDSHQHVHLLPGIFDVVAKFCVSRGLPLRIPWVWPHPKNISFKKKIRQWVLKQLLKRHMLRWNSSLKANQGFISCFDLGLEPQEITPEIYRRILIQNTFSPLELMVHPAQVDDDHRFLTQISTISEREYAVLTTCDLGSIAAELGYEVIHYGNAFYGQVGIN